MILDRFECTGYQESTTVIVCGSAIGSANDAATAALNSHGSNPEGVNFPFAVQSIDPNGDSRWFLVAGDYTLDGSDQKFENCRAIDSSSGANAVLPFSFGGAADNHTIRIYGSFTHEQFPKLRSGISVSRSTDQPILANTLTKIAFDTEEWDISDEHVSGTYTSDYSGYRICSGQVTFEVGAALDDLRIHVKVNGTDKAVVYSEVAGANNHTVRFNILLLLDVDDTVEIHAINADSADQISSTAGHTFWQMIESDGRITGGSSGGGGGSSSTQRIATNGSHATYALLTIVAADCTLPSTPSSTESITVTYKGLSQTNFTVSGAVVTLGFTPDTSTGNEVVISYVEV